MDNITNNIKNSTVSHATCQKKVSRQDGQSNFFSKVPGLKPVLTVSEIVLRAVVGYFLAFVEDLTVLAGDVGGVPKGFNKVKENRDSINKLIGEIFPKRIF